MRFSGDRAKGLLMGDSRVKGKSRVGVDSWQTISYDENGLLPPEYVHKQYKDSQGHSVNIQVRVADDMAGWASEVIDNHPGLQNISDVVRTALHFYLGYVSKAMKDNPALFEPGTIMLASRELDRLQRKSEEKEQLLGQLDLRLERAFNNMDFTLAAKILDHAEGLLDAFDGPYRSHLEAVLNRGKNRLNKVQGR